MRLRRKQIRLFEPGVEPPRMMVSYVGAVCSALRACGVDCDVTGTAGFSGYAFIVNVAPGLVPASVTGFDWSVLNDGINAFGIAAETVVVDCKSGSEERDRLLAELFERVGEELDRGSPCVIWGVGEPPGFAVVYGRDQDCYLVRSILSALNADGVSGPLRPDEKPEPPVRHDALADTGRLGAVFFGEKQQVVCTRAEQRAVERAGQLLAGEHSCFEAGSVSGWPAFEFWADELVARRWQPAGNSYTLHCLCELQLLAAGFCRRLGQARPGAGRQLEAAAGSLHRSADRLEALRKVFPLSGEGPLPGPILLESAARSFRACSADNRDALNALRDAAAMF